MLAKSRREAMVKLGLSGKVTLYITLYLVGAALVTFLPSVFMELSPIAGTILLIVGVGGGGLIYGHFYRGLIRQGLLSVIQQQNA